MDDIILNLYHERYKEEIRKKLNESILKDQETRLYDEDIIEKVFVLSYLIGVTNSKSKLNVDSEQENLLCYLYESDICQLEKDVFLDPVEKIAQEILYFTGNEDKVKTLLDNLSDDVVGYANKFAYYHFKRAFKIYALLLR